ncbi:MAG: hypothetical protein BGO95_07665 [Micrococcales bacterium 73-13]|nr:MAG: hypothetical protein BGO95_07665 [Micrococcales bacterium 73-13]
MAGERIRFANAGFLGVVVMAALTALYLAFSIQYAIIMIRAPEPLAQALGWALIVLPLIAIWYLVTELVFAVRGQRLLGRLAEEGGLPVDDLPRLPSGRPDAAAAKEEFPRYQAEVEAEPDSWRAWVRLALAYDAAGDRGRARWATREALKRSRAAR